MDALTNPDPLPAHEREVRAYAADSADPVSDEPRGKPDGLLGPYTLAEAEVIARHAGKLNWWAGRIMRELDTVRAQNVELRKLLAEERRERRERGDEC